MLITRPNFDDLYKSSLLEDEEELEFYQHLDGLNQEFFGVKKLLEQETKSLHDRVAVKELLKIQEEAPDVPGTNKLKGNLTVPNSVPSAVNDSFTLDEDDSLSSTLSTNDTNSRDGVNVWSKATDPAHGSVTVNASGTFIYTPNENYNGNDSFTYTITDRDGDTSTATVNMTINPDDLFQVTLHKTDKAGDIKLQITSQSQVSLEFDMPSDSSLWDTSGSLVDASTGLDNFTGTKELILKLTNYKDIDSLIVVTASEKNADGDVVDTSSQAINIDTATDDLVFNSSNQNMWGPFDGYIDWHEYVPLLGDAPIEWDAATAEWKDIDAEYWSSGKFNVVDALIDSTKIIEELTNVSNIAIDTTKDIFDKAIHVVDLGAKGIFDAAKDAFDVALDIYVKATEAVDVAVQEAFQTAKNTYETAQGIYDIASDAFHVVATGLHNVAVSTWNAEYAWYNSLNWLGKTFFAAAHGVKYLAYEAANVAYSAATVIWDTAKEAFETTATNAYNLAIGTYNAATSAIDSAAQTAFEGAQTAFEGAQVAYNDAKQAIIDTAQVVYDKAKNGIQDALAFIKDKILYDSEFKVDTEVFAQVGLQVDFELDLGSVDTSIDYALTSKILYNQDSDTLTVIPTMTNSSTSETVAFNTISPNAKFYAALLYDVYADFDIFIDGQLTIEDTQIFDLSPGTDGLTGMVRVSNEDLMDVLGEASSENLNLGKFVIMDFDTSALEPFEIPFIEDLTKDILSIEIAIPTLEVEGKANNYIEGMYNEGALVKVDFTEITSAFLNTINAKVDFGDDFKAKYGLESLKNKTLEEIVASVSEGFMKTIWDVMKGQSEAMPIFEIDMTDETSTSLLHLNLVPDSVINSSTNENTGNFGFYAGYGESDPILKFSIDIDAAYALIVNEIVKAAAAVASGGTSASFDDLIPVINPYNIKFGIEEVLKLAAVPKETREKVTEFVDLGFSFEAADLDITSEMNFTQDFTLSIDDMSYLLTLEDGFSKAFTANNTGAISFQNASKHDVNSDGKIDYTLNIVPTAMFSNDTEIGFGVGYTLDFLKGGFGAGLKLPLDKLFGIKDQDWLNLSFSAVDINMGPLLSIKGELDTLDIDIFENRFELDVGEVNYVGTIDIDQSINIV